MHKKTKKWLCYINESGVPLPELRCQAVSWYKNTSILRQCRRNDTHEIKLGKRTVLLCAIHKNISLEELEKREVILKERKLEERKETNKLKDINASSI